MLQYTTHEEPLAKLRKDLIEQLWIEYLLDIKHFDDIFPQTRPLLDHFAIIDIGVSNSNIPTMQKIFESLGFETAGSGYLPQKFNDFIWMREPDFTELNIQSSLPQVVLADFRVNQLSITNQQIIKKYTSNIACFDFTIFKNRLNRLIAGDTSQHLKICSMVFNYLNNRPWKALEIADYLSVKEENELIAWVLLMGRKINHFGIQISAMHDYTDLTSFLEYFKNSNFAKVNNLNGEIKGSNREGIAQASSLGERIEAPLRDGKMPVNNSFIEFVWRYPKNKNQTPMINSQQYLDFFAGNANYVIESLYDKSCG